MKRFPSDIIAFLLIAVFANMFLHDASAGNCDSISRTNFSANTILTSTELNSQLNGVYAHSNDLDGGCITDATLESTAPDSSWATIFNQVQGGCKVTYSDATTLSIGKCAIAVNDNLVNKATSTSVAFGCTGCSSETATSAYYVYVKSDSSGSTITPLILSTAPDSNGYDVSNNKVIARFFNADDSDINQYSIDQWHVNRFIPQETGNITGEEITVVGQFSDPTYTTTYADKINWERVGERIEITFAFAMNATGTSGSGRYLFSLPAGLRFSDDVTTSTGTPGFSDLEMLGHFTMNTNTAGKLHIGSGVAIPYSKTQFEIYATTSTDLLSPYTSAISGTFASDTYWKFGQAGTSFLGTFSAPIESFTY